MAALDIYYDVIGGVNNGLKINDVTYVKRASWCWLTTVNTKYVIKRLCNGIAGIEDTTGKLHFSFTENLIRIGHIQKCVQFEDKSLCLI